LSDELFSKPEEKRPDGPKGFDPTASKVNDVAARLKIVEERYTNLTKREQLAEQGMLQFEREFKSELKAFGTRLVDTKRHVGEIRERLDLLEAEMKNAVQKHELRELDAYVEMWQPTRFLTRAEAEKMIEEIRRRRKDENT